MEDPFFDLEAPKSKGRSRSKKKERTSDIVTKEFQYFRRKLHSLKDPEEKKEWIQTYLREIELIYDRDVIDKLKEKIRTYLKREEAFKKAKQRAKTKKKLKRALKLFMKELLYNPRMRL